jgi:serine/threonine protein kinase
LRSQVMELGGKMLELLRQLHERGYVHRDLKPENFLLGKRGAAERVLYLIDLGIARRAPDCSSAGCDVGMGLAGAAGAGGGIEEAEAEGEGGQEFAGTCRFASSRAHACLPIGRGDDLEALVYCLVFLLRGNLPWDADGIVDWGLYIEVGVWVCACEGVGG